jgi:serine/threonine protein kinase
VRVHDFGTYVDADQRVGFYTADLLVGMSLSAHAARHRWPAVQRALGDALEGLAFLHGLGIRHGDFKPDNIIVGADGRATLIDLSCAARFAEPVATMSGTPGFLAPELAPGAVVDERADFFSVGATLRQLASDPSVTALAARLCDPLPASRPAAVVDILAALGDPREIERAHARSARLVGRQADIAQDEVAGAAPLRCGGARVVRRAAARRLPLAPGARRCDERQGGA